MTSSIWLESWAINVRLNIQRILTTRDAHESPQAFRHHLYFTPTHTSPSPTPACGLAAPQREARRSSTPTDTLLPTNILTTLTHACGLAPPLPTPLEPWQHADFAALDPAWQKLAGHAVAPRYRRAWIERPRGHAKTSDMAVQVAWILLAAPHTVEGIAAAADRDQTNLLWDAVQRLARLNPHLCADLHFRKHHIQNPRTGSALTIVSSDVHSSWGALVDFVICDELCHWDKPDLWHSLLSTAAKKPDCLLAVLTNAGTGRGWQWELREAARTSPLWYFSSLDGAQAPWITPEHLAEQQALLPRPVYLRLWQNQWQHSDGEFVTLAEAEACRDETLTPQTHGQPHLHYIAAIDYAEKHDLTVATIIHVEFPNEPSPRLAAPQREARRSIHSPTSSPATDNACGLAPSPRLIVDRMDVVAPTPNTPTPVDWVERWIETAAARFPNITFIVDEYQLLSIIQRLSPRYDIRRFSFQGGKGNHALALTLRKLILHQHIAWYPHCGQLPPPSAVPPACGLAPSPTNRDPFAIFDPPSSIPTSHPRDDLETELASLLLKQSPTGLCRIDHRRDNLHHDDRAFTLGAAALHALSEHPLIDDLQITPPTTTGDFNFLA